MSRRGGAIPGREWLAAGATALALSGCAVGPDFLSPEPPAKAGYASSSMLRTDGAPVALGEKQRFVPATDIPHEWWRLFHSRALNSVIADAIAANPSLEAAEANLRSAVANVRAQEGSLYPTLSTDFSPSRSQTPTGSLSPATSSGASIFNLFTAQASISYTLDVFGGIRRSIEAQRALADFQLYELQGAYLTLVSSVANAAVGEASLREQIDATKEVIASQRQSLGVLQGQNQLGQIQGLDVVAQETALAQTELTLPPLYKALGQTRNLLSVLIGNFPSAPPRETFRLADLHLPRDLPLSVPSALVRQRPDVMAAEANLHAASAQVGVAIANRLPNLTLSANYGASSVSWDQLLLPGNRFWGVTGNVAQTIFDGGTLRQHQKAAEAAYDAAAATYRSVVLTAFQNVADALKALECDSRALAVAFRAERSAYEYLNITQEKLKLGALNSLSLLNAQQAYQQARIGLIQAQAARVTDTIALFQALGGGWWKQETPSLQVVAEVLDKSSSGQSVRAASTAR